ncbi:MAG: type II toxin-antitoxin system VapC family toxin [Prochlorococcaceae cyanobacterium]
MSELVLDTSALMALLLQEPEAEGLLQVAASAATLHLSAATRLELSLVAEGTRTGTEPAEVDQLLLALGVAVVPFDQNQLHWALQGWRRFGKGRDRAGLNLGDCFSYGLAMALEAPLLFKGSDFSSTDVAVAWTPG